MSKSKEKIQFFLNEYLEEHGKISILLPDGATIELGITQEGKRGEEIKRDYCWINAKYQNRNVVLDKYSLSLNFPENALCFFDDLGSVDIY